MLRYLPECVLVFLPESRTKEAVTFMMKAQDWYVKKGQLTGGTGASYRGKSYSSQERVSLSWLSSSVHVSLAVHVFARVCVCVCVCVCVAGDHCRSGDADGSPQQHAYRFLMLVLHKLCHEAFIPVVLMHPPSRL